MDKNRFTLLQALKLAATQADAIRLYRSGKLAGLFEGRTRIHAELASEALREGWLEIVRSETRGKTTFEWVQITQRGIDFLLEQESPARALDDLNDLLRLNAEGFPLWIGQLRQEIDQLGQKLASAVERMHRRLDQVTKRASETLQRLESLQERPTVPMIPWANLATTYLEGRPHLRMKESCPLPELFAYLKEKGVQQSVKEFHRGLKRLLDRHLIRLLPWIGEGGPPEPEYALVKDGEVMYFAARVPLPHVETA